MTTKNNDILGHFDTKTLLWSPSLNRTINARELLANKVVVFYFSASWCGPCQRFTPKLIEMYNSVKKRSNEKFELVYCSMDRTALEYDTYTAKMPWWCMARNANETSQLAKAYGAQGIPHLVVLDVNGRLISSEGVSEVNMDPSGLEFPWRPKPFAQVMPQHLLSRTHGTIRTQDFDSKYLMLYFGAQWCPPCNVFATGLSKKYMQLKTMRQDFELVFVSRDESESAFNEFYKEMTFSAVPFNQRNALRGLYKLFEVRAIPTLLMLGPMEKDGNRKIISRDLVSVFSNGDFISDFPYHPKPYGDLTTTGDDINSTKCLIVFHEQGDDDEQEDVVEALKMAAENFQGDVRFYWALAFQGLAANVRNAIGLTTVSSEPTMIMLDLQDNGAYYLSAETDIHIDSILDFVQEPGERRQVLV